jgi:pyruvate kinase
MYIIEKCKIMRKPLYLQTNILKSMTKRMKPTVTEISNLDYTVKMGFDGLILKEELTMAPNHIQILEFLKENLFEIESLHQNKTKYEEFSKLFNSNSNYLKDFNNENKIIESIIDCSVKSTFEMPIGFILLNSDNYNLVQYISKYQPNSQIFFLTNDKIVYDYLNLIRGVKAFITNWSEINDEKLEEYMKM